MPPRTRTYAAKVGMILLVLGCLSLTSCARDERVSDAKPTPTVTPLFASEEEALEAARATYEGFMEATEENLSNGGAEPDRIDAFMIAETAEVEKDGYEQYAADGRRLTGRSQLLSADVQAYEPGAERPQPIIILYVCVDFSDVDVVDVNGVSTVASSRPPHIPFEVSFVAEGDAPQQLKITANTVWTGGGVCAD